MPYSKPLELAALEYRLLCCFAEHPRQLLSQNQLPSQVWGAGYEGDHNTLHSSISRLRSALGPTASSLIQTQRRLGYRFVPD